MLEKWFEIEKYVNDNENEVTIKEIAHIFNCNYITIYNHYKKLRMLHKFKRDTKRDTKYDWNSIDREVKENISKLTINDVSEMYNIPYQTIYAHFKKIGLLHIFYK